MADTDPAEVTQQLWNGCQASYGLDIGARRGESVEDFKRIGCNDIDCFEPSPTAFPHLQRRAGDEGFNAFNVAISDHDGTVRLASVPLADQKGELVTPTEGMEWSVPNWNEAKYIEVKCWKLDTWCGAYGFPGLVKIDTEGHEAKVLDGASYLLGFGCTWLIEFHSPQNYEYCCAMLEGHGYNVQTIRHPHYAPESSMWYQHGWIRATQGNELPKEE